MAEGDVKSVRVTSRISEVDSEQWDVCAGSDNPFVSHAFLDILEQSEAASIESGWLPQHLLLENESGQLIGAVPCYLKNHSYGEYVFVWGLAEAFERPGGKYYPKCGTVLQAYMKRTLDDIDLLKSHNTNIRLCKGAYKESEDIAYQDYQEIRNNYMESEFKYYRKKYIF